MLRYLVLEIRRMYRDRRFVFFTIALPVAFYLLWSNIFTKSGDVDTDTGLNAKTYLLVSMSAFGALGASLTTTGARLAAERGTGWLRQLQVTPLRPWAVIVGKLLASMCLALPAVICVGIVAAVTQHVHLSPGEWAALVGVMWVGTLPFAALGTLIGSLMSPDAAQPLTVACYMVLAILGGMWMSVSVLPKAMRTIAHWSPSNRFADLGWSVVAGHTPPASDALVLAGWTMVLGGLAVLAYRRATVRS
jgi:ABC-2 type transport system permease protein